MNLLTILGQGADAMIKEYRAHSSQILTGICVSGLVGTGISASVATVKSCKKVAELEKEKGEKLTVKEVIKSCWKYYIPTAIVVGVSGAAGIKSCDDNLKANAAMATILQTTEANRNDILKAAEEVVGKKKANEIEAEAETKAIKRDPPTPENVYLTKYGTYLFRDSITGTYFRSCETAVQDGIKRFNMMARDADERDLCFGDLFDYWGVDLNRVGNESVVIVHDTWCTHQIDCHMVYEPHSITGEPCAVIKYSVPPFDYDSIMWYHDWK